MTAQAAQRGRCDLLHGGLLGTIFSGDHHAGFQEHAFQPDALLEERVEDRMEHRTRDLLAAFDGMRPIHQNLWLHNRYDALFLAQGGIPGQCMGINIDTHRAW